MKPLISISLFLFLFGCKGADVSIPQAQVIEVLTQYGNQNPETNLTIQTSEGNIDIHLFEDTPLHRANFIRLIKSKYFRSGVFYRIVENFIIQGGNDLTTPRPGYKIPMEIKPNHIHKKGAIAMASDNPGTLSSGTEFYLIQGNKYTPLALKEKAEELKTSFSPLQIQEYSTVGGDFSLDNHYTVFGEITKGFEVVEKIAAMRVIEGDKAYDKVTFNVVLK
jgi:cyclophilin family peptidyl-prolyl cis-trans isomerase